MKKSIYKFLFCVLVLATLCIPAFALSWDGSSQGGGGNVSSAGKNGYAIRTSDDNCVGYRFSVVDKNGNQKGSKIIDVFRNTSYGNMEYSGAYKFNSKQNKKQLINNQNNGFGTSKNTNNCYKETNMGFASSLPKPSGMNSWQNDGRNLNQILLTLGINKIAALKNGDKVLVEPLYDVRLEGTYHALTVTEIAMYGKYILGVNSNGGASKNSGSWGFISNYTNRYYPNELYTPDGQGLWSGAGALGGRATFYNIINKGYGVGIAYTETKPDFTPNLSVNICEAWPGNKGVRNSNHYGISNGASFNNYSYGHGYPIMGDKVWFAVNFPAESENCYVRQSVWVDGGGQASRNVYSHSGTWYDVALSPNTVDSGRSAYVVKARVDWIDGNGNVKKWGSEKTFYIPVRPKINRYQVTMYDYAGKAAAYNGSGGKSGAVYVGQKTYPKYTYTSDNTWTSTNTLNGYLHAWKSGSWKYAKNEADMSVSETSIRKGSSYSRFSRLFPYRVPDNSTNTNGSNRIPFLLTSAWSKDTAHTYESAWIDIPILKADVELLEIRLIDEDGYYIPQSQNVWVNQKVTPQYTYKNNTDCTVYVEGYDNDKQKIGVYSIAPNSQAIVNGKQIKVTDIQTLYIWGGVYLEGAGRGNTSWEKEDYESQHNNHWLRYWNVKNPLSIEMIMPNSDYRKETEVMTSFKVKSGGKADFIQPDNVSVRITVTSGGSVVYTTTKTQVVIPGNNENLAYFKWTVPSWISNGSVTVKGEIIYNGKVIDTDIRNVSVSTVYNSQTPDTIFEKVRPNGWTQPSSPNQYAPSATWSEWTYVNGSFVKKNYGVNLSQSGLTLTPDDASPSAVLQDGIWNMKSGYGYSLIWKPSIASLSGKTVANPAMYTGTQNGYAMLPEYSYSTAYGKHRTLQNMSGNLSFKVNSAANNSRIHFIPIWYPNGTKNYTVSAYAYDCWTPAGMIAVKANSNSMTITGSMYDDHYIGRGN